MLKHLSVLRRELSFAVFILIIVLCAISFFMIYKQHFEEKNTYASVFKKGILIKRLPLSSDCVFRINENFVIEIKSGKARVKETDCPGKYCVKQGWSDNIPLICVPNETVIQFDKKDNSLLITY